MCSLSNSIGPCTLSVNVVLPGGTLKRIAPPSSNAWPLSSSCCRRRAIAIEPLRLEIRRVRAADLRALVPIDPQPAQAIEDAGDHLGLRALDVGVFDAQDERAAVTAGIQPVEESGARAADMQVAGGRRGEPEARGHRGSILLLSSNRDCGPPVDSLVIPEGDERQALRLRRYLMAAGTSLMVIVLLYVAYLLGGLERAGFVQGTALILFWVALFYVMLRSGTEPQVPRRQPDDAAAGLVDRDDGVRHVLRRSRPRGAADRVPGLVSVRRLSPAHTPVAVSGCDRGRRPTALMVAALYRFKPDTVEAADEILQLIVLAVTLPWFAVMGGYVSRLRDEMTAANRELVARQGRRRSRGARRRARFSPA